MSSIKDKRPDSQEQTDILSAVMGKLEDDDVQMHGRRYFACLSLIYASLVIVGTVFAFFLLNTLFFVLSDRGILSLHDFGVDGVGLLFGSFPWLLFIAAIVVILGVLAAMRRYEFSYKHRSYMLAGTFVLSLATLASVSVARDVREPVRRLPAFGNILQQEVQQPRRLIGKVISVDESGLSIEGPEQKRFEALLVKGSMRRPAPPVEAGQYVVIYGSWRDDEFVAQAIQVIDKPKSLKLQYQIFVK